MASHSNGLAWRIPRIEEPGGPQSVGSQRVGHDRGMMHAPFLPMSESVPTRKGVLFLAVKKYFLTSECVDE